MIPSNLSILMEVEIEKQPSKNYKMYLDKKIITGHCDELETMKQVIFKILNTERYKYVIYSWGYGIELKDLFGEPISYVCSEIQDRITEALLQDDRIIDVTNFDFSFPSKGEILVSFVVLTVFGEIQGERKVNI